MVTDADLSRLNTRAWELLDADLRHWGNKPDPRHEAALKQILDFYGLAASGRLRERRAFDLDTGCGKTASVIAWLVAVVELGLPFSVAIASELVTELSRIKRVLIDKGVPPAAIGLQHSKKSDPAAGILPPTDDNHERQIVLTTHARIQSGRQEHLFNSYRHGYRDLIIWDESLIATTGELASLKHVKGALGAITGAGVSDPGAKPAVEYLAKIVDVLSREDQRQREWVADAPAGRSCPVRALTLPRCDAETTDQYEELLTREAEEAGYGSRRDEVPAFASLLGMAKQGRSVRLAPLGQGVGEAVITYTVDVPDHLRPMAILDASFAVRKLARLDKTVMVPRSARPSAFDFDFDGRVKRYGQVTINHWERPGGRDRIEKECRRAGRRQPVVVSEVARVVDEHVRQDEAVLIFYPKLREGSRDPDVGRALRAALARRGVDLGAAVEVNGEQRPRLNFRTHGQESATNDFSHCSHVILCGVYYRPQNIYPGRMLGAERSILGDISSNRVHDIWLSEVTSSTYQAISRGCSRVTENGEAKPMTAWVITKHRRILDELRDAMPGVRIEDWPLPGALIGDHSRRKQRRRRSPGKAAQVADAVGAHLDSLGTEVAQVRLERPLYTGLGIEGVSRATRDRGIRGALASRPMWARRQGRLERVEVAEAAQIAPDGSPLGA